LGHLPSAIFWTWPCHGHLAAVNNTRVWPCTVRCLASSDGIVQIFSGRSFLLWKSINAEEV
jgi:hypothetical protein